MNENEFELNGKQYKIISSSFREDGMSFISITVPKIKTNGDRIRAMSNEELAEYMYDNGLDCDRCIIEEFCNQRRKRCKEVWLDWMNSPAESGEKR